ncbi:hypothetical protein G9A89_013597 [Geosiphon pyriformis]|nr:hypothetical protein G9A89_013597 [Geosiphon pyriformis]
MELAIPLIKNVNLQPTDSYNIQEKRPKTSGNTENILVERDVIETTGIHSQISESGDTTESESIDMEKECLVEETSIDYGKRDAFNGGDPNQILKSLGLKIKTKKVLGKPLDKINFEDSFDNGDFLDEFALLPPSLLLKSLVQVSVHKSFTLDIDLVAVAGKFFQEKSNFIKKIFLGVNGFVETFTPSKFGGIICATFTSEKAIMAAANLANKHEIPMETSIEAVRAAVFEFGVIKLIKMQLKNAVRVVRTDINKQTWDSRDRFRILLYTLSVGMNAHDLWNFLVSVGGKTCIIDHNSVNYTHACCATVCFDSEEDMNWAVAVMPVIKGVGLHWSCLSFLVCSACDSLGHTSLFCKSVGVSLIPKNKRAPLLAHD